MLVLRVVFSKLVVRGLIVYSDACNAREVWNGVDGGDGSCFKFLNGATYGSRVNILAMRTGRKERNKGAKISNEARPHTKPQWEEDRILHFVISDLEINILLPSPPSPPHSSDPNLEFKT